ncbi:MAG TPA: hypothetical protein VEG60_29250 [Candidatus Binatia bacterium]|nr:hypothetical protein [Candidatus Binatia bacterium]
MNRVFLLIGATVFLGSIYVVAPVVADTYRRYGMRRTVICPETGQIAEVELRAVQASLFSALGKHWVRVKWCSLWPRKKGCAEKCVDYGSSASQDRGARAHESN